MNHVNIWWSLFTIYEVDTYDSAGRDAFILLGRTTCTHVQGRGCARRLLHRKLRQRQVWHTRVSGGGGGGNACTSVAVAAATAAPDVALTERVGRSLTMARGSGFPLLFSVSSFALALHVHIEISHAERGP